MSDDKKKKEVKQSFLGKLMSFGARSHKKGKGPVKIRGTVIRGKKK